MSKKMKNKFLLMALLCACVVHASAQINTDSLLQIYNEADTTEYGEENPFMKGDTLKNRNPQNKAQERGDFYGLDYVMERRFLAHGEQFTRRWDDHLFLEVGAGMEQLVAPSKAYHINPLTSVHLGIGKQFHKYHSIRFLVEGDYGYRRKYHQIFYKFSGKLDYLFSLSSYVAGYNPSRMLDVSAVFGGGYQLSSLRMDGGYEETSWEGHAGMQLRFFTGPQGYFNIEPYVGLATDGMDVNTNQNIRATDVFYGVRLSYIYYIHNNLSPESRARFIAVRKDPNTLSEDSKMLQSWRTPWFLEFSNGLTWVKTPHYSLSKSMGHEVTMSVGKWLSPVIGFRASASARMTVWNQEETPEQWNPYHPAYVQDVTNMYMAGRVEAMFNPLGFNKNYNWDGPLGFYLLAGTEIGWLARYERDQLSSHSEAYDAGLHLWARLSDGLQVFMEPRWSHNVYRIPYNNVKWSELFSDNTYTVNVGLTVMSRHRKFRQLAAATVKERPTSLMVGVAGGMSMFHSRNGYDTGYNASAFAEFYPTHYVGARLSYEYIALRKNSITSFYDYNMTGENTASSRISRTGMMEVSYTLGAASLDVSLNMLNTLYGYRPGRLFDFYLYVGPTWFSRLGRKGELDKHERLQMNHTVELVDSKAKSSSVGVNGGLRLQCNISRHVGVFFSPHVYVMLKDMMPEYNMLRVRYLETLSMGVHCKI